jgi:hypothetical protein
MARRSHWSSKNEVIVLSMLSQRLGARVSWEGVGSDSEPAMATGDAVGSSGCIFKYDGSYQAFELHLLVSQLLVGYRWVVVLPMITTCRLFMNVFPEVAN